MQILQLGKIEAHAVDGLPDDARIIAAKYISVDGIEAGTGEFRRGGIIELVLKSETFGHVPTGEQPPIITPIYQSGLPN